MKTQIQSLLIVLALFAGVDQLFSQGTAFTYQGWLNNGGAPASGLYDFRFKLYVDPFGNTQVGTSYLTNAVPTTNGLFITTIDFGAGIFTGTTNWLEVDVRTNGGGGYTILNPFQELTPTPYAIFAETASNLSGTLSAAQLGGTILNSSLPASPNFSGTVTATSGFAGDGTGVTNVNATLLGGLAASNYWQTGGNNVAPGQFLGSTNNQPVVVKVNGQEAERFEPTTDTPNVIGGYSGNFVQPGLPGVTIGGGGTALGNQPNSVTNNGYYGTIAGGYDNTVTNYGGAILGGSVNFAGGYFATVGGGQVNKGLGDYSFIGGGYYNTIQSNASYSAISGGYNNYILGNSQFSMIGSGYNNQIQTNASFSFIGSGQQNIIQTYALVSTIAGGIQNAIYGDSNRWYNNQAYGSFIGGGAGNVVQPNSRYSTIAGGQANQIQTNSLFSMIGGGDTNQIQTFADHSMIGGGEYNQIQSSAPFSTIAGGVSNLISANTVYGTIGGGTNNFVNGISSTVAGGEQNQASAFRDTVGGGLQNQASGGISTVAGGWTNVASGNGATISGGDHNLASGLLAVISGGSENQAANTLATVPGGYENVAGGYSSFAAGYRAQATNYGAFVWSDGSGTVTASTNNNSVTFRASGGYRIFTSTGTAGAQLLANATSWTTISDRNAKKNFEPVDTVGVLDKLAAIPMQQWNYKWEKDTDVPNIGPMAQDFKHAFYPGRDDTGISTLEFDGVELAAIQGLNQKLNEKNAEIQELKQSVDELKAMVKQLAAQKQ